VAHNAHSKRVLLTHIPLNSDDGEWALSEARTAFSGPLEIAEPLRTYDV